MGCQVSKTDIQLGKVDPWMYTENGQIKSVDEEYLNKKREEFWKNKKQGNEEVWDELHRCCGNVLQGDLKEANAILAKLNLTVISGELSLVKDSEGNTYTIEKYCYSNPANLEGGEVEESNGIPMDQGNNKFRFRIGSSFLDEEREIVFVFDKDDTDAANEEKPKEHSPENHMYYHTYHFKDNLETITELQVREKVLEVIRNFPEVKDKMTITNLRLFYMGRELCRNTPFILNKIPFDCVIVVLVQYV